MRAPRVPSVLVVLSVVLLLSPSAARPAGDGAEGAAPGTGAALRSQGEELSPAAAVAGLPLSFIPNVGQLRGETCFHVQGPGPSLAFTPEGVIVRQAAPGGLASAVRISFVGGETERVEALEPLPGVANFYLGRDESRWREGVPTHEGIAYRDVWPGVDVTYSGTTGRVKSEVRLAPGADPSVVQMRHDGVLALDILPGGDLVARTAAGEIVDEAPTAWQEVHGVRVPVACSFVLLDERTVGFDLGPVDPAWPLVIDPVLDYSTYFGGGAADAALGVGTFTTGTLPGRSALACGRTASVDFPVLLGSQDELAGATDAFAFLLDASGDRVLWSTYVGGSDDDELRDRIGGGTILAGTTRSSDVPRRMSRVTNAGGADVLLVELASGDGTLEDTFLWGGSGDDEVTCGPESPPGGGVIVGGVTTSTDLPVSAGFDRVFEGGSEGFVAFLRRTAFGAFELAGATFLGGEGDDAVLDISGFSQVWVSGQTSSADFPVTAGVFDSTLDGASDGFVAQIGFTTLPDRWELSASTLLGGSGDDAATSVAGSFGPILTHVAGWTTSDDFPTVIPFQAARAGGRDAFVATLRPDLDEVEASTYLGGGADDEARGVAAFDVGRVRVAGWTDSASFPVRDPLQPFGGGRDAFLAELEPAPGAMNLTFSTHLGGSGDDAALAFAVDQFECSYLAGVTSSADLPLRRAAQPEPGGDGDAFVMRICDQELPADGEFDLDDIARKLDDIEECACEDDDGGGTGSGGDGDCDIDEVLEQLAEVDAALELEEAKLDAIQSTVGESPSRAQLEMEILANTAALVALEAKLDAAPSHGDILAAVEANRARLDALETKLDESAELDLDAILEAIADVDADVADLDADVAALEAKADEHSARLDDLEADVGEVAAAVADLDDDVAALEAKADEAASERAAIEDGVAALEVKADDAAARFDAVDEALAALEAKADEEDARRDDALRRDIEVRLDAKQCVPWLWLPEDQGGLLEVARDHVASRIADAVASGDPDVNPSLAAMKLADADAEMAMGRWSRACSKLSDAIRAIRGN